jgi:hypothetical protein
MKYINEDITPEMVENISAIAIIRNKNFDIEEVYSDYNQNILFYICKDRLVVSLIDKEENTSHNNIIGEFKYCDCSFVNLDVFYNTILNTVKSLEYTTPSGEVIMPLKNISPISHAFCKYILHKTTRQKYCSMYLPHLSKIPLCLQDILNTVIAKMLYTRLQSEGRFINEVGDSNV